MRIVALGDRDTQFLTHRELDAALALLPDADWVATDDPAARDLHGVDGVWMLPGTPYRDEATAFGAIRHCVATGTRFLGTCGGFQYACLALARDRAGLASAAHAESDPEAPDPVVEPLACTLCGTEPFEGFHWCGYGLSAQGARALQAAGVMVAATAPDAGVEAIELPDHPFFLATAFQPQVGVSETGSLPALVAAFAD